MASPLSREIFIGEKYSPKPDFGRNAFVAAVPCARREEITDRKSTRLNSSHRTISYAVFCLKKKKNSHAGARNPAGDTPQSIGPATPPGRVDNDAPEAVHADGRRWMQGSTSAAQALELNRRA